MVVYFLTVFSTLMVLMRAEASDAKAFISEEIMQNSKLHRRFNEVLSRASLGSIVVENRTSSAVTLKVYDFYHEPFEEEDFASGTPTLAVFDRRYSVVRSGGRNLEKILSQVFIKPYREKTEVTATQLVSYTTILPGSCETIRAVELAYIGKVECEDSSKHIFCEAVSTGIMKLIARDSVIHSQVPLPNSLLEIAISSVRTVPFLQYMASTLFKEHRFTKEELQQKFSQVQQAGFEILMDKTEATIAALDLKVPQITHTIFAKKRVGSTPLVSENQKKWLKTTTNTLSSLAGWKHFVWVFEDPSSVTVEDLGDAYGAVEVRSIAAVSYPGLHDVINLIQSGDNRSATAFLQYALLAVHGGVIRSVNTEIIQDLTPFNKIFSFYAELDASTARVIDAGVMAAAPEHPIIMRALDLARYHTIKTPSYIAGIPKSRLLNNAEDRALTLYHVKYGSGALSIAFQKYAEASRDMIFSPLTFSPLRTCSDILSYEDPRLALTPGMYAINYAEGL